MEVFEKPFWLRPPYVILFDLLKLHRIRPWDVNVAFLLNSFLMEMRNHEYIDFTASGTALLSSAIIHRMKSEVVLKMEEPPKPPVPRPQEEIPPPLQLPLRFEYTSTSIEHVLRAIEEVLKAERSALVEKRFTISPPAVLEQVDEFLRNIEQNIEEFFEKLSRIARKGEPISFRGLIRRQPLIEVVRVFLMLLFLANDTRVQLFQGEEKGDILVHVEQSIPSTN